MLRGCCAVQQSAQRSPPLAAKPGDQARHSCCRPFPYRSQSLGSSGSWKKSMYLVISVNSETGLHKAARRGNVVGWVILVQQE